MRKIIFTLLIAIFIIFIIPKNSEGSTKIYGYVNTFLEGDTYKLLTFTSSGYQDVYVRLPAGRTILDAKMKMKGLKHCVSCGSCSYTPGCPCSCVSPYTGGGVASCNSCSYTPSCSGNCVCPSPGSGGGIKDYKSTYTCRGTYGSYIVSCGTSTSISYSYPGCSQGTRVATRFIQYYGGAYMSVSCSGYYWKGYVQESGAGAQVYSTGSGLSGNACSATYTPQCTSPVSTSKYQECSTTSAPSSVSCRCSFSAYEDSACSLGVSATTCYVSSWYCRYSYDTESDCQVITSSGCPSINPCSEGYVRTCSYACNSCNSCSYTPSPPSCSCSSPYSGGGCASCNSCSYTPGCSLDNCPCSCPSPGSGGGCSNYGPDGVYVDTLADGTKEFGPKNDFYDVEQEITLNISAINNYLQTCTPDSSGFCNVPIRVGMSTFGRVNITSIYILFYSQPTDPTVLGSITNIIKREVKLQRNIYTITKFFVPTFYSYYVKEESDFIPYECKYWPWDAECKQYCPDCYFQAGKKALIRKSVKITNVGYFEQNFSVGIQLMPEAEAESIKVYYNDSEYPIASYDGDRAILTIYVDLKPQESKEFLINFTTTPVTYNTYDYTEGLTYYRKIDVNGFSNAILRKVFVKVPIREDTGDRRLYDGEVDVTDNPDYSVSFKDTDANGYADSLTFVIPYINTQTTKKFTLVARVYTALIEVIDKKVEYIPFAGENIVFNWTIRATNIYDRIISFREPLHLPLEATNPKLNDIPKPVYFSTTPPYGPYIYIEGILNPRESKIYNLIFTAPPVTAEVSPPRYPLFFMVGERARLYLTVNVKNWIGEFVEKVKKDVNVVYAENLSTYLYGILIDSKDVVRGYYTLEIENLKPYESRTYTITYYIPTAEAKFDKYYRMVINNTMYLGYPFRVKSLSPYPLTNVYIRVSVNNYKCQDYWKVYEFPNNEYPNIKTFLNETPFECQNGISIINVGSLNLGEEKSFAIFVKEKVLFFGFERYLYDLIDVITNFVNWLIRVINNLLWR